jgi:hypothetical protein
VVWRIGQGRYKLLPQRDNSVKEIIRGAFDILRCFMRSPRLSLRILRRLPFILRGFEYGRRLNSPTEGRTPSCYTRNDDFLDSANPLKLYFDTHAEGPGIWKWIHYFAIYHRYFSKFVGREVHVLEIGVYGGGSLQMWREYFGPNCRVYGVDIEEACRV